jgi:hypothetical protein
MMACVVLANAQSSFKVVIKVKCNTDSSLMTIGVNPGNSIGIDTASTLGAFREVPAPPAPPAPFSFDCRIVTIPGRVSTFPIGLSGGVNMDIRGYVSAAQVDTFKIKIDGDNTDAYDTKVSWPANLSTYATAWLIKPQTGTDWPATDMIANTSVTIPATTQKNMLIIKTGAKTTTAVAEVSQKPVTFALEQNYPNPFNPTTEIRFSTPQSGFATLKVYSILGQEVATLLHDQVSAGTHTARLNGSSLASGVYLYKLNINGFTSTRRMLLVK